MAKSRDKAKTARQSWDLYIDKMHGEMRRWKSFALLSMLLNVAIVGYGAYYFVQPKFIPYVVTIDSKSGDVDFRGVMKTTDLTINDAMIRNYLIRFVTDIATVSTDAVAQKKKLIDSFYIASPEGQKQLTEHIEKNALLSRAMAGTERVDIRFISFEKIQESTWRVQWSEHYREKGLLKNVKEKAGTFSYETMDAATPQEAEMNPLGIYFSNFFITDIREQ